MGAKAYRGIQVRGDRIRVYFNWGGRRHFKSVGGQPTPETLSHYARMIEAIESEIASGKFVYQKWFPAEDLGIKFEEYAKAWLKGKELEISKSSFKAYESRMVNHVLPRWGSVDIEQIDYLSIQDWTQKVLMPELTNKTVRDIQSLMSQVFRYFRLVTGSTHNPTEGVSIRLSDPAEPFPFTRAEINRLLAAEADPQIINMVRFMFYTGLRLSEVLAVTWDDIDMTEGTLMVKRARVSSTYKVTKTRRSTRKLKLLRVALKALADQHPITGQLPPVDIEVMQRDNRTARPSSHRFVWHNPNTNRAFSTADNFRTNFWAPLIESARVRYRGPGQTRHTYASQLLSSGLVSVDWIAHQMGHSTTAMIYKHYGRWIPEDSLNIVGMLDSTLNFE